MIKGTNTELCQDVDKDFFGGGNGTGTQSISAENLVSSSGNGGYGERRKKSLLVSPHSTARNAEDKETADRDINGSFSQSTSMGNMGHNVGSSCAVGSVNG